jgi:hypothetical protein
MQENSRDDVANIVPAFAPSVYGCPGQLGDGDQPSEAARGQYHSRFRDRRNGTRPSMMTTFPLWTTPGHCSAAGRLLPGWAAVTEADLRVKGAARDRNDRRARPVGMGYIRCARVGPEDVASGQAAIKGRTLCGTGSRWASS